jgi:hypothetical protein
MTFLQNTIIFGFVPVWKKIKLKNVNAEFQAEVGYWAFTNHLHMITRYIRQ